MLRVKPRGVAGIGASTSKPVRPQASPPAGEAAGEPPLTAPALAPELAPAAGERKSDEREPPEGP
jgi:hypothetical protein